MRIAALAFSASLLSCATGFSPAQAAPQILGLIASGAPVPMICEEGTCTAELSSVCLQEYRSTPATGTAYLPSKKTRIMLTVTGSDGVSRSRAVEASAKFASIRQYTAVRVSLAEADVRALGAGAASLTVAPMASLVPVAVPGDPKPLSDSEIALYTGPLRAAAEGGFERDSARVDATRVLNRMINRMPEDSRDGIEKAQPLVQASGGNNVSPGARRFVSRAVSYCRESLRVGMMTTLRKCLGYQHDYLSGESTNKVWDALKPGS